MFAIRTATNKPNSLELKVNPSNYSEPKTMKSAIEIARYFLCRVDREAGDTISLLKLQKLVYYAQA